MSDQVGERAAAGSLVSVVIPVWGVEAYLAECLESVAAQTHATLEIIVVDDASPDDSRAIAEDFAARDGRVRVLSHVRNLGLGAARNTGARAGSGDYLFFLDSDDVLAGSAAIARLVAEAHRGQCKVVIGACADLMDDGRVEPRDETLVRGKRNEAGGVVRGLDALIASFGLPADDYLPARAWGALIERRFYEKAALDFPAVEHEDLAHTPFLYFAAGAVAYQPEVAVHYRVRAASISNAPWSEARIRRYGDLWGEIRANLRRFGLEAQEGRVALFILSHLLWRLENNNPDAVSVPALAEAVRIIAADSGDAVYENPHFDIVQSLRRLLTRGGPEGSAAFADLALLISPRSLVTMTDARPACF